jgi:hypothetical protein
MNLRRIFPPVTVDFIVPTFTKNVKVGQPPNPFFPLWGKRLRRFSRLASRLICRGGSVRGISIRGFCDVALLRRCAPAQAMVDLRRRAA